MIGTHGDAKHGGSIIENISFENIDILEHHEPQDDYLGCMAVNVGDGEHPSLIRGFAPDKKVEGVRFKNLVVRGVHIQKPEDGNIQVGEFAEDIFES